MFIFPILNVCWYFSQQNKESKDQLHKAKKKSTAWFPEFGFDCQGWIFQPPGDIDVKGVETSMVMEMMMSLDVVKIFNIKSLIESKTSRIGSGWWLNQPIWKILV